LLLSANILVHFELKAVTVLVIYFHAAIGVPILAIKKFGTISPF